MINDKGKTEQIVLKKIFFLYFLNSGTLKYALNLLHRYFRCSRWQITTSTTITNTKMSLSHGTF